jgi:hypothetical protein
MNIDRENNGKSVDGKLKRNSADLRDCWKEKVEEERNLMILSEC